MKRNSGFTLVELLITITIIAILAAIVVPRFSGTADKAKISRERSTVDALVSAANAVANDTGAYPSNMAALLGPPSSALGRTPEGLALSGATNPTLTAFRANLKVPYVETIKTVAEFKDIWSTPYYIIIETQAGHLVLNIRSNGPDKVGPNADDITALVHVFN